MFKKAILFTAATVMALAMIVSGCSAQKSTIIMDIPDEKTATLEFNKADEGDFVQSGYISVAEGEGIEVVSDLNEGGRILIGFIAVPENQSADELPDMDTKYEMMISGVATQGGTFEPGEYDLKITVQGKATGTVTINVKPAKDLVGAEGAKYLENEGDATTEESSEIGHTDIK